MKKQSGFSLIELIVAMAVLALIMGAMVHLFGSSVTSLQAGSKQEVVYEEARLLMNELKTTLRYADSINPPALDAQTTSFTYSGTMWNRHMDINDGTNVPYKVTVEWQEAGNGLKQLKVTRINNPKSSSKQEKTTLFPNDSANSLFKEDSAFPITSESIKLSDGSVIMYNIALPVQYLLNGQMKTQTLETKVVPSRDEVTETPEEKMRREYMEILSVGLKIHNNEKLTSKEEKLRDEFSAKMGENQTHMMSNDKIREYMCKEIYGGHFPSIDLTTSNDKKISPVWFQPACFDMTNVDNVFVMGREFSDKVDNSTWIGGWYVRSVYDYKRKVWRTGKSISVMSENWDKLEALMEKQNYQDVKKVEYN